MGKHRVVIVGGGFAGVECVRGLKHVDCEITWIDSRNFHLFQPLLYQVATGGLSPGDITAPLRTIAKDVPHATTLMATVTAIDVSQQQLQLDDGAVVGYDSLVLATGVRHSYFGNDAWEAHATGLKSIEDATRIRAQVLGAFEMAEKAISDDERKAWLRFVIVGGGPTGVELAGALGELATHTLKGEYRHIRSEDAQILLVEGSGRILSMYVDRLSNHGTDVLRDLGVAVLLNTKVIKVDGDGVDIQPPTGPVERIASKNVLWAAGVQGSPLGKMVAEQTGAKLDRAGRVTVEPDLTLATHRNVFVLGDLASFTTADGPLPGIATVAMQMGKHAAKIIGTHIETPSTAQQLGTPFVYFDKGNMAVIGRNQAVARIGVVNWSFGGFFAWLAWLLIHVVFLVGFENRVLVLMQWANHYFTRHRGARLITPSSTHARR
jgi:NADH:ubiquinone reductase (H+-translocating)